MDARDTSQFGWTNQQVRGQRTVLGDLEAEIVTKNGPAGTIRDGVATTATLTIATTDSIGVRVVNRLEGRSVVFGLDGSIVEADGWHLAKAAEIGAMKAARGLLDGWATDPSQLVKAGVC